MRIEPDPLKQYTKLRKQLVEEKTQLETRLAEINQVLDSENAIPSAKATAQAMSAPKSRKGPLPKNTMSMREVVTKALTERGPLTRKELGQAVLDLGYKSKAKNVLGSIGNLLYGKNSAFKSQNGKFHLAAGAAVQASRGEDDGEMSGKRQKRRMSAATKAKLSLAATARWAKARRAK
jgi:hypothetical protein